MPQEPKRRHSRERKGKRRASIHFAPAPLVSCQNCQKLVKPHVVCLYCGFYKGKKIVQKEKQSKKVTSATPA